MFAGMMKESSSETVTIFDVEPLTMESLINFCYSGSVTITEDNVTDLLKAADLFQVLYFKFVFFTSAVI